MAAERVQRRLAAVFAADVVGYSRMIRAEEEATLAALAALRAEVIDPTISGHGGRIFKLMGDGVLAEFPSVVEAVRAAVEIQQALAERDAELDAARKLRLRIGIHLGDVIVDGDDLQGDGVNLASRLEGLAEPGGLCISGAVHEQIRDRIDLGFADAGEQSVKNIDRPIRVWRWPGRAQAAASAPARPMAQRRKPSLAVLPFANISGDPSQEYFADGMVDEITTSLARIRWITVIARNSSFAYKGRVIDVRRVCEELGVGYVVEGSVRKAGSAVRLTAQLVEADTAGQLWADKFTDALDDVFDLQDEITAGVVAAIEPSVRQAEIDRAKRKRPDNLDAYDLYLRGLEQSFLQTPTARAASLEKLDAAIALEPDYAEAHGVAAFVHQQRYLWGGHAPEDRAAALSHAEAVASANTDDTASLAFAAMALSALAGRHEDSVAMLDRGLERNPSSAVGHLIYAVVCQMMGRPETSEPHAESALRLSPFDPARHLTETLLAVARLAAGDLDAALSRARRGVNANPSFAPGHVTLALCLVAADRLDEARESVRRVLAIAPDTRLATLHERFLPGAALGFDRIVADLRRAGLPE